MVTESQLWILDEPFTSLDKKSMAGFELMFEQHLAEQGVIVMTSHHDIGMVNADIQRLDLSQ
jgi:heme exporter protein A